MFDRGFLQKLAEEGQQALKKAGVDFKVEESSIDEILGQGSEQKKAKEKPTAEHVAAELNTLSGFGTPNEIGTIFERTFSELGLKTEEEKTEFLQAVVENIAKVHPQFEWKKIQDYWSKVTGKKKGSFSEFAIKSIVKGIQNIKSTEQKKEPEQALVEPDANNAESAASVDSIAENPTQLAERKEKFGHVVEIFKDVEVTEVKTAIGQVVFYTNKGIGYSKDHNEDRVVINTEKNGYAVVDGMGGMGKGEEAAEILAEQTQKGFLNNTPYEEVQKLAHAEMFNKAVGRGGACYVSTYVDREGVLHGAMAGDVRLIVVNTKGEVVFQTKDEGVGVRIFNVVQGTMAGKTTNFSYKLEKGYKVLMFSDGISDNFDDKEDAFKEQKQGSQNIADFLNGKTLKEAVEELKRRQEEKVTIFTNKKEALDKLFKDRSINISEYDAEIAKLDGKPDNVALVAFEYSGEENIAETKERVYEWNADAMDALDQNSHPAILEYKEMLYGDFAKSLENPNRVQDSQKARDAFLLWWGAGGKYNEIQAMKEEGLLEDWQEFLNSLGANIE